MHRPSRTSRCALLAGLFAMLAVFTLVPMACRGGGGGDGTANGPGGGYGVTSNVGTLGEDVVQNESPDQDPFVENPNPIPD